MAAKFFVYTLQNAVPGKENPEQRRLCFRAEDLQILKGKVVATVDQDQLDVRRLRPEIAVVIEQTEKGGSDFTYMVLDAFRVFDPVEGLRKGERHRIELYGDVVKL